MFQVHGHGGSSGVLEGSSHTGGEYHSASQYGCLSSLSSLTLPVPVGKGDGWVWQPSCHFFPIYMKRLGIGMLWIGDGKGAGAMAQSVTCFSR